MTDRDGWAVVWSGQPITDHSLNHYMIHTVHVQVSTVPQSCGKSRILAYFPHSRIFGRTSRISGFISKQPKSLKIAIILPARIHFVRKSSAKTTMIASPSYYIFGIQKSLTIAIMFTVGTRRHFVRKSSAKMPIK